MSRRKQRVERVSWYRKHPARWINSFKVKQMTWAQRGVYTHLLDLAWLEGDSNPRFRGSIPADDLWIAVQLGMEPEVWRTEYRESVLKCFREVSGRLWNEVMRDEARDAAEVIKTARDKANKRWGSDAAALPLHTTSTPAAMHRQTRQRQTDQTRPTLPDQTAPATRAAPAAAVHALLCLPSAPGSRPMDPKQARALADGVPDTVVAEVCSEARTKGNPQAWAAQALRERAKSNPLGDALRDAKAPPPKPETRDESAALAELTRMVEAKKSSVTHA